MIPGLSYLPEYLDQRVHDDSILAADRGQWLKWNDHPVQVYGYGYNRAKAIAVHIGDLPPWATEVAERLRRDCLMPAIPGNRAFPWSKKK